VQSKEVVDVTVSGAGSGSGSGSGAGLPPPQKQQAVCNTACWQYAEPNCSYVKHVCTPPPDQAMGRAASIHWVPLLVLVVVVGAAEAVKVDVDVTMDASSGDVVDVVVDTSVEVMADDAADVVLETGVEVAANDVVEVVVEAGIAVVQLGPVHLETWMSAQFQNFSAPLLLVLGSTTAAGHEGNADCHHALASPPNLEAIHDCVEPLL